MLKYVLLGALNYRPLTGYELKTFIEQSARHFWHARTSQIYRTLDKLDDDGLLTSEIEERDDKPDLRRYHITPAGREDLRAWLAKPMTEVEPTKSALIVRLFFSAQLDKETVLTQLRLQKALHEDLLPVFQIEIPRQLRISEEQAPQLERDRLLWDIARRQGELQVLAMIDWLNESIQRIENNF
jgi:PadR family transcriptional regulator AphA